jgi:uncharacterized protein Yka (UPF0111/DUF47 family)
MTAGDFAPLDTWQATSGAWHTVVSQIVPSQAQFYPLFERHAAVVVAGAQALRAMLAGGDQLKLRCDEILALEHEADGVAREVLLGLRTSFITPFDRADIQSLITSLDDSIDQMKQTAKAIVLFEATDFEPDMRRMADAIVECAELVQRAVSMADLQRGRATRFICRSPRSR